MADRPMPVILDVDTGYDDALAILLALGSSRLAIQGITCVAGNQRLPQVVRNTLTLLDAVNAPAIPVAVSKARRETPVSGDFDGFTLLRIGTCSL